MRLLLLLLLCVRVYTNHTYRFFLDMQKETLKRVGGRRAFVGNRAQISDFPLTCRLMLKNKVPQCSGVWVNQYHVLTVAHCIQPTLFYVLFNSRSPKNGDLREIQKLYKHEGFNAVMVKGNIGQYVSQLYHDIGLVKTHEPMFLAFPNPPLPAVFPLEAMKALPHDLTDSEVQVVGFVHSVSDVDDLTWSRLRLRNCTRNTWTHCMCGWPYPGDRHRDVCSGESGASALFNGTLVALTSLGPAECGVSNMTSPKNTAIVLTLVPRYLNLINNTINIEKSNTKTMKEVPMSAMATRFSLSNEGRMAIELNFAVVIQLLSLCICLLLNLFI